MGYRKKRGLCIWVWMGAGLSMIWQPQIQFVLLMGLLATFLSFALLDES